MRPADWPTLLSGYVEMARRAPRAWGTHDCATFACGWWRMITGIDVYAPLRGKYDTEMGAARMMVSLGFEDMEAAGDFFFGTKHKGITYATRGDIVLACVQPNALALGICVGASGLFLAQEEGLLAIPFRQFTQVWAVD